MVIILLTRLVQVGPKLNNKSILFLGLLPLLNKKGAIWQAFHLTISKF